MSALRVAVLGLGEAGGRIASDLVALGADVSGWDPDPSRRANGVRSAASAAAAADRAEVVLSANSASAAVTAARDASEAFSAGQLYADLNTASRLVKLAVAEEVGGRGALFADVALMAPVPERGVGTPALASGPGAASFVRLLGPLGMPVEVVGDEPGDAAERKLIRSVFVKGVAAAAVESLAAAEAAGCEEWLRDDIATVLAAADPSFLDRLVDGSRRHAARRIVEMEAACELLRELGVTPRVASSAAAWLADLEREVRV